jgi:hypothetical protein
MPVQFDERAGFALLAGRTERALGDGTVGHIARAQNLKELVQFALERAFDQVEQEQENNGKRQGAAAAEVWFGASVPGNEGRIVDEIAERPN